MRAAREGVAAVRVHEKHFDAWNARDMELACEQWAEDVTYEYAQYADAIVGEAALRCHLLRVAAGGPSRPRLLWTSLRTAEASCSASRQ